MSFPLLHVISPQGFDRDARFTDTVVAMQTACGPRLAFHLRAPGTSGKDLFDLTRVIARSAAQHGGWCVVNERVDVALAGGAQAAQLGYRALPLAAVRRVVGERLLLGCSAHSVSEVREAAVRGANYVVLGTIFPSLTHPGAPVVGSGEIARCRDAGIPVVAIGGIDAERVAEAVAAGASGVAVIRAVWDAEDPVAAATALIERLVGLRAEAGNGE